MPALNVWRYRRGDGGRRVTVRLKFWLPVNGVGVDESVAEMAKLNVPLAVGVPLNTPPLERVSLRRQSPPLTAKLP